MMPADRAAMILDFGVTATAGSASLRGIFDNAYTGAFDVAGSSPAFMCRSEDAASLTAGASVLTISGADYLVIGIEPDGTGMSLLRLQEV